MAFKALKMFTYDKKMYQVGDIVENLPQRIVNLGMAVEVHGSQAKPKKAQVKPQPQIITEDVKPVGEVLTEDTSAVEVVKEPVSAVEPVVNVEKVESIKPLKKGK